jgi:hypothetical protein
MHFALNSSTVAKGGRPMYPKLNTLRTPDAP